MKQLFLILAILFATITFGQTTPPAPSTGRWLIVDTNYTVGTSSAGITKANLYYRNIINNMGGYYLAKLLVLLDNKLIPRIIQPKINILVLDHLDLLYFH